MTIQEFHVESELSELSVLLFGTGFIDSLPDEKKWALYEQFEQRIQFLHPDTYEDLTYEATNILRL